ncbi:helix-turn-helix transcriptional regulator [Solibacillus sp.]|uniref:helix-turn-helix transcriptional regulator n=1 Tax=Solibacillus sp. TaxID=1909654 RepID=UPI003314996A
MKNLNLINARKKKGWTQEDLAKAIKCAGKATISNWETGYSKPRLETAITIARVLDEDVAYLFGY